MYLASSSLSGRHIDKSLGVNASKGEVLGGGCMLTIEVSSGHTRSNVGEHAEPEPEPEPEPEHEALT